jgi:hypothetical protein
LSLVDPAMRLAGVSLSRRSAAAARKRSRCHRLKIRQRQGFQARTASTKGDCLSSAKRRALHGERDGQSRPASEQQG